MDRPPPFHRPPDQHAGHHQNAPPPVSHAPAFPPPTAHQPPVQVPFDPFNTNTNRDPFLPGAGRRGSLGLSSRAWPPSQGNNALPASQAQQYHSAAAATQLSPPTHSATHSQTHPPPPANGLTMQHPYDDARRRSLGAAGSPHYGRGPLEPPPQPPSYPTRNMPPPSSPQNAPTSSHLVSAPRGPPTASPFAGVRDIGSSHRSGMSISAILGGGEERKPMGSPHSSAVAPTSTPKSMQPPSPGRARSASMRESGDRGMRHSSPPRVGIFGEPPRTASEPRRDNIFGSPQFRREPGHSFRAFQPAAQEHAHHLNGHGAPARPTSQPVETVVRGPSEIDHRDGRAEGRPGFFRPFGEPPTRAEPPPRVEQPPFHNGVTSHPHDRPQFSNPQAERERMSQGPGRFQPGGFGGPLREEQSSLFRPAFQPTSHPIPDSARESGEGRAQDMRRQLSRPSPNPGEPASLERNRNGFVDRPMHEEHQRIDMLHRGQQRKESEGSVHRAILNISPELNRKGRNSPLPQAVQGAQPRHIGPGGDNPGIKMEFGRMFSGLGSGVGSTPAPHHAVNGTSTPSRMSPSSRHHDGQDLVRSAVAEIDQRRSGSKAGSRAGRRNGRRSRDDGENVDGDGRHTPDLQRNKRAKTNHAAHHHHHHMHPHHMHHHHHHHHEQPEVPVPPGSFLLRFNPTPGAPPQGNGNGNASQGHHHHHHHAHPGHHHHHAPHAAPPARKPSTTVLSEKVINECANKPRKHLGSQLYTTEVSMPPASSTPVDARIKFASKMKPIPVFQGQENCTFTVRVPRYYLTPSDPRSDRVSSLEEICKHRQLWGTEIYTDDSDVVAAAVHSGWVKGDFGEYNDDLLEVCDNNSERDGDEEAPLSLKNRPPRPVKVPAGHDAHITLLILPPLQSYAATTQHHILSRDWKETHDGMSYMVHGIDFVDEGASSRYVERSGAARKNRIAMEEANKRQEAAAGLLMFANGTGTGAVRVGA